MKTEKKESYNLITPTSDSFAVFKDNFETQKERFVNENVVISFLDSFQPNTDEINSFLAIASDKKQHGTSFVLVIKNISIDDFPEELNIVPTIIEAEDVIEMENIERELGF